MDHGPSVSNYNAFEENCEANCEKNSTEQENLAKHCPALEDKRRGITEIQPHSKRILESIAPLAARLQQLCSRYTAIPGDDQPKYEAAWCSTFSCLKTSQTRDSAGFQVSVSQDQIDLQMSAFLENSPIWVQVEHKVDGNSGTAPT
ncbi:hypothetical protein CSKR_112749 [Clonorchis sinensis]|uniref:Uncharacterized protein n=1 Tax=Clonorchis sinensis TaxID=79923 RepID=A0A3R7CYX1_CLOSI|nr:hypothetical protein CSKR_112749 [Clonorchis sinensis]